MSEEQVSDSVEITSTRPDPFFKLLTKLEAEQLGLQAIESEQQFTTRADLILNVPFGLRLQGTMFEFFRAVNILEFKSENDKFNLREYLKNEVRTTIQLLQSEAEDFSDILNVIVSSRFPRSFFEYAEQRGIIFQAEAAKPWLWKGRVGFQDVAVIVCINLPIEEPFYRWLIFAPSESRKWRDYLQALFKQGNLELIQAARRMRPKEFDMAVPTFDELLAIAKAEGLITPEEEARRKKEKEKADKLLKLRIFLYTRPDLALRLVTAKDIKEFVAELTSEEQQFVSEELVTNLTEKERQFLFEEVLARLAGETKKEQQNNQTEEIEE